MAVTKRQLLLQLDGDNASQDVDKPPARQAPRLPVREQSPEMNWNGPKRPGLMRSTRECGSSTGYQPDCSYTHNFGHIFEPVVSQKACRKFSDARTATNRRRSLDR